MKFRILKPLDKYVLGSFFRILLTAALGFPLLVTVINLSQDLSKYISRGLPAKQIAISYVYEMPETLFQVLPAAVLFATIFTIGNMTRHSELTAAKASGISFYRIIAPLFFGSALACGAGLVLGELTPAATARRNAIIGEKGKGNTDDSRYGFAYSAEGGRVYTINQLEASPTGHMSRVEIVRRGTGPDYPTTVIIANDGAYRPGRWWLLTEGAMHIISSPSSTMTLHFTGLRDKHMTESPRDLLQKSTEPEEMRRAQLQGYIAAMERSGQNVNRSRVDLMLRIAVPATCLIIFLFAAPLATNNQRGGSAYGVAIALGTTILFLMMVQLTQAIGGKGLITPEIAAWIPGMVFGAAGLVLLTRVRT